MLTALTIGFAILNTFIFGSLLSCVWGWFIVPLGVVEITFWHALGISSVVSIVKVDMPSDADLLAATKMEEEEKKGVAFGKQFGLLGGYGISFILASLFHYMMS